MNVQDTVVARPPASTEQALAWLGEQVGDAVGQTGERIVDHAAGTAAILAGLGVDLTAQIAACVFGVPRAVSSDAIEARFGPHVRAVADGMRQLLRLRLLSSEPARRDAGQLETLRRMLLAMGTDIRVVLLRLASRLQTLRYFAASKASVPIEIPRETLDVLAPLANRLGVWQIKWELEDLSFRFLEPELYRDIALRLEERRVERERFVEQAIAELKSRLAEAGVQAEVSGRPKHLYSIWNKMRAKGLAFEDVQDLRAFRVIVPEVRDCYAVLAIVHEHWPAVAGEYDDYIARPKANGYQSLHTVVRGRDGRPLEIQIRTRAMHEHAEHGVAAHWRYKEQTPGRAEPARPEGEADRRIAWARQLLAWQRDVGERLSGERLWGKSAALQPDSDRIFVLTPQGRIIELPAGSTPVDFAYHVHTSLGHRCRGARVDGQLVPLTTQLRTGQTVEVIAVKPGSDLQGPSRDWMNAELGYVRSPRARAKVRHWFNTLDFERDVATGRTLVERALQREGRTALGFEELAHRLHAVSVRHMFVAVAKEEIGPRQLEDAIRGGEPSGLRDGLPAPRRPVVPPASQARGSGVTVGGVDFLMTQLAKCCRPVPPDPILGFVTRGRGISVHRRGCPNIGELGRRDPERVIAADWAATPSESIPGRWQPVFPVDVIVRARDRPALLRDVSDVFARDRLNVIAVATASHDQLATMRFTVEVPDAAQLARTLASVRRVPGVTQAERK